MAAGKISVHSENIFPIIKKFLYSDHEIFLRELVSNAVDATQKLKTLTIAGENKTEVGDANITVAVNKEAKTLTISDCGIGMTHDEVEKYINQIAFSGAEEFLEKYKNESENNPIIGHFGLGFYSAFMVAGKVEFITKSYKDAPAVKWTCDGSTDYTLEETEKAERGTEITLYINDDSEEFLEAARIKTMLDKYCKFLPVTVMFEDKAINNTQPAWKKKPADLTTEDYNAFYKELYPFNDNPLFHIHLNVDYPFNLTGVLYFPKHKPNADLMQKNKIQLYCNQVFVTDNVEGIVPEFLTLMHGVIDSPDIPLNVSRSYLQSDGNVKKISSHITKKVADKLEEIFNEQRADFETKWDDLNIFIKYGILSDDKFYDRAKNFCLLKNTDGKYFTFEEYKTLIQPNQEDKDKRTIYLYTNDAVAHHSLVEAAKNRGYDVLLMNGPLDSHFLNMIEQKMENASFARIDADVIDNLINKTEKAKSTLTEEQETTIKEVILSLVEKDKYTIQFEAMQPTDAPVTIAQNEFMRRMKEMSATGGGMYDWMNTMPENFNMIINANHPLVNKVLNISESDMQKSSMQHIIDLALLEKGMLKGPALTNFVKRNIDLMNQG
ncbi:MAG: molecular chaperone HtpG [Bacteroidetes bacterium]|nr:molecular chaperone HtpG [Bacteroidota bacterium]